MIIDTSAIVAILGDEPEKDFFIKAALLISSKFNQARVFLLIIL